jgi:hypothetical protein
VTYLRSLEATREMDVELLLPGHGDPITDHRALIDERFALHRRRAEKIHRLIEEKPRTGYEIAQALWGNVAVARPQRHRSLRLGLVRSRPEDAFVAARVERRPILLAARLAEARATALADPEVEQHATVAVIHAQDRVETVVGAAHQPRNARQCASLLAQLQVRSHGRARTVRLPALVVHRARLESR